MPSRRDIGAKGELIARNYLMRKGMTPIKSNYSTRYGEIDLILKDKNMVVFVEVKTKSGQKFGRPEEMFTPEKYLRVRRMAEVYLGGKQVACRIDVVAVELDEKGEPLGVRHYENVTGEKSF